MPLLKNLFDKVIASTYYRKYVYSDPRFQLVAMSLSKGESIPTEVHAVTQTFFVLKGRIVVILGDEVVTASEGDGVVVPAGTTHTVTAVAKGTKLMTIYAPIEHPMPTKDEPRRR